MKFKSLLLAFAIAFISFGGNAQIKQIYDESINPLFQLEDAIDDADQDGKYVLVQLGGNWCKWCIRLAKFIENDPELKETVNAYFEYIHVNYNPRDVEADNKKEIYSQLLQRLGNPTRFGFPVLIVLDGEGKVIHTQDSALLESGDSYDKDKVLRFLNMWKPGA